MRGGWRTAAESHGRGSRRRRSSSSEWQHQRRSSSDPPTRLQRGDLLRQQGDAQDHHEGVLDGAQHLERERGGRLQGGGERWGGGEEEVSGVGGSGQAARRGPCTLWCGRALGGAAGLHSPRHTARWHPLVSLPRLNDDVSQTVDHEAHGSRCAKLAGVGHLPRAQRERTSERACKQAWSGRPRGRGWLGRGGRERCGRGSRFGRPTAGRTATHHEQVRAAAHDAPHLQGARPQEQPEGAGGGQVHQPFNCRRVEEERGHRGE